MANTVVSGKGTPVHIGGSLSDGIFFQNIGTNPVFIGYGDQTGAAVSSGSCDGVIQAGGTYSVGAKRDVWLYADVDTPIVYNYDATASADGGTNVSATVAGSVAVTNPVTSVGINGKPNVAIPDGVAINGPVAINGNVGIVGSVGIAGNVNVQGQVLASQAYTTLNDARAGVGVSPFSQYQALTNRDVSAFQTIAIHTNGNNNPSGDIGMIELDWMSADGNTVLFIEDFTTWVNGSTHVVTAVKGPLVTVKIWNLSGSTGYVLYPFVFASTLALPEVYQNYIPNNTVDAPGIAKFNQTGGSLVAGQNNNFIPDYGVASIFSTVNANSSVRYNLSSMSRRASYTYTQYGGNMACTLYAGVNQAAVPLITMSNSLGNLNGEVEIPRAPLYAIFTAANATGQSAQLSLAYQRF